MGRRAPICRRRRPSRWPPRRRRRASVRRRPPSPPLGSRRGSSGAGCLPILSGRLSRFCFLKFCAPNTGTAPSLTTLPDVEVAFDDADLTWFNVWSAQTGNGSTFKVSHAGSTTTVRLGSFSVALIQVQLAAGQTRNATGATTLPNRIRRGRLTNRGVAFGDDQQREYGRGVERRLVRHKCSAPQERRN